MTVLRQDDLLWVADRDGIAHAKPDRDPRTLCDRIPTPSRWAWPRLQFCGTCTTRAAIRKAESKQRKGAA